MNKRDYFIQALNAGACKKRTWLNAAFNYVVRETDQWDLDVYPFKLRREPEGLFFVNPQTNELELIEDAPKDAALFGYLEGLHITPREVGNHVGSGQLHTTYGNCLVNHLLFVLPFGTLFPFFTGFINIGKIGNKIAELMIDDPDEDDGIHMAEGGKLYARQFVMFADNAFFLKNLATNNVVSVSPKSLRHHPDRDKVRAAEIAKYTPEQLTDPAVIASIGNVLEELDRQWLAGDSSEQYYMSKEKKLIGIVRKRMHYMFGGESPFGDGTSMELIVPSLQEGIDTNHMPVINNSIRYGSYSRGNQTKLGGETTKTIYRMLGTVRILEPDCGTTIGIPTDVTTLNQGALVGLWRVEGGQSTLLTHENLPALVGKTIALRGPMTCKTGRNVDEGIAGKGKHICERCAGIALSEQPGGMAAAAAGVGGRFLNLFLKKMHGSILKTTQWDFNKHLH